MSDATTRVHHPYSPSKLQALEACPKYQSRQTESKASRDGTAQHDAAEAGEDSNLLDDHQAIAVAECLAYTDNIAKGYPGGTILKEVYLPIDEEVVESPQGPFVGTTAGYLDWAIISKDETEAEIVDFKFGQHAVESAENNLQGMAYMLGAKKIFPKLRRCTVRFVMPHRDEVDIHTFELTDEKVAEIHVRIRTVVGRAVVANSTPSFELANPNLGACLFCSRIGECSKVGEVALKVGHKFSPLQVPANVNPSLLYDTKDTSFGIKVAQVLETWSKSFRAAATEKSISDPDFIPDGYNLIPMQRRKVVNARLLADISKEFITPENQPEIEKLFDIPIGHVEDLIKLSTVRGQKTKMVEAFGDKLLALGAVEPGQPYAILKQTTTKKDKTE